MISRLSAALAAYSLSKAHGTVAAGASVAVKVVRVPLPGPPYKRTGTAAGPRKRPEQRRPLMFA